MLWYVPIVTGIGIWGAKRSILTHLGIQRWVDILLSITRLGLLMDSPIGTPWNLFAFYFVHGNVGTYLERSTLFMNDSWLPVVLVASMVHDLLEYGWWRILKWYSHWLAILLCVHSQGFPHIPMGLYLSLGAFESVNVLMLGLPSDLLLFKTTIFGLVRIVSFALLTGTIFHGQWILSAALAMQGMMFYEMAERSYNMLF